MSNHLCILATLILDNPDDVENNNSIIAYHGDSFGKIIDFKEKSSFSELDLQIQEILRGCVIVEYKKIVNEFFERLNDNQEIIEYLWDQMCTLSGRIDSNLENELKDLLIKGRNCTGAELDEVFAALIQKVQSKESDPILQDSLNLFFPSGGTESLLTFKRSLIDN